MRDIHVLFSLNIQPQDVFTMLIDSKYKTQCAKSSKVFTSQAVIL
jgi:hypothetical protein